MPLLAERPSYNWTPFPGGFSQVDEENWILPGWGIGLWFIGKTMIYCTQEQWTIPKKYPSRIYKHWKSNLDNCWECFMYENSELSCWNFIMGVNGVPTFYIEKSLFLGAINHCFDNKSQTDPSPWFGAITIDISWKHMCRVASLYSHQNLWR